MNKTTIDLLKKILQLPKSSFLKSQSQIQSRVLMFICRNLENPEIDKKCTIVLDIMVSKCSECRIQVTKLMFDKIILMLKRVYDKSWILAILRLIRCTIYYANENQQLFFLNILIDFNFFNLCSDDRALFSMTSAIQTCLSLNSNALNLIFNSLIPETLISIFLTYVSNSKISKYDCCINILRIFLILAKSSIVLQKISKNVNFKDFVLKVILTAIMDADLVNSKNKFWVLKKPHYPLSFLYIKSLKLLGHALKNEVAASIILSKIHSLIKRFKQLSHKKDDETIMALVKIIQRICEQPLARLKIKENHLESFRSLLCNVLLQIHTTKLNRVLLYYSFLLSLKSFQNDLALIESMAKYFTPLLFGLTQKVETHKSETVKFVINCCSFLSQSKVFWKFKTNLFDLIAEYCEGDEDFCAKIYHEHFSHSKCLETSLCLLFTAFLKTDSKKGLKKVLESCRILKSEDLLTLVSNFAVKNKKIMFNNVLQHFSHEQLLTKNGMVAFSFASTMFLPYPTSPVNLHLLYSIPKKCTQVMFTFNDKIKVCAHCLSKLSLVFHVMCFGGFLETKTKSVTLIEDSFSDFVEIFLTANFEEWWEKFSSKQPIRRMLNVLDFAIRYFAISSVKVILLQLSELLTPNSKTFLVAYTSHIRGIAKKNIQIESEIAARTKTQKQNFLHELCIEIANMSFKTQSKLMEVVEVQECTNHLFNKVQFTIRKRWMFLSKHEKMKVLKNNAL